MLSFPRSDSRVVFSCFCAGDDRCGPATGGAQGGRHSVRGGGMGGRQLQLQRSGIDLFVCRHSNHLTIIFSRQQACSCMAAFSHFCNKEAFGFFGVFTHTYKWHAQANKHALGGDRSKKNDLCGELNVSMSFSPLRLSQICIKIRIWCGSRACGPPPSPATWPLCTWRKVDCWLWPEPKPLCQGLEVSRARAVVFTVPVMTQWARASRQGPQAALWCDEEFIVQMSLLADLPNQITQVIENAVGQRRRKGKKNWPTYRTHGIPGSSLSVGEREVSMKWIRGNKGGNGGRITDELWRNAGAWKVGAFHEQDVDLIPTTAPLVYWQGGNSVTVSQGLTPRRPADLSACSVCVCQRTTALERLHLNSIWTKHGPAAQAHAILKVINLHNFTHWVFQLSMGWLLHMRNKQTKFEVNFWLSFQDH